MRLAHYHRWGQYLQAFVQSSWRSLLLGLVATIAVFGLWQQLLVQEQKHLDDLVQQQVEAVTTILGKQLSIHVQGLERMANRWRVGQGTPQALWAADAKAYISYYPGYQAINWVDPTFHVRWVVPLKGNESAKNFDTTQDQRRRITLQVSRDLRQTLLTRTVNLVQGGEGFVACVPLFVPGAANPGDGVTRDRFDGWIIGVFRFSRLFDSLLLPDPDYQVEIYDGTHLIYRQEGEKYLDTRARTGLVHTYGADWQVKVFPTAAFITRERSPLPGLVLWGGLALSWLLALAIDLSQRSQRQARRVRQVNQQLQAEIQHREQVESSLRASEERWHLAIRGSNDGIWDWQVPTNEVFFSSRWKSMLGFTDDEISHQLDEWSKRVHPDDLPVVMAAVQAHFAKETPFYLSEHRVQCKDGSYKWILDRGQALWDDTGQVIRMTGSHTDITERKQAELALQESEARFQAFMQNAPVLAWIVDAEGTLLYANSAFLAIVDPAVPNAIGQPLSALFPAEFVEGYLHSNQQVLDTGQVLEALDVARCPDGSLRQYLVRKFPLQHQGATTRSTTGATTWVAGVAFDVTEQKQAELVLKESEARFQAFMQNAPINAWIADANGILLYANPAFAASCHHTVATAIGQPISALFPPELVEVSLRTNQQVIETGNMLEVVAATPGPDGTQRQYLVRKFPLHHAGETRGEPAWVGAVAFDVTERQAAELAVRQSEERFREIAETIQDVFFINSPDLKQLDYISPAYEGIWGRSCASLYAHPEAWLDAIHPDDRDRISKAIEQQMEGVPFQEEYRIVRPDGAVRWIFSRAFPSFNEAGELQNYIGLASDITERKQVEITQRALIESIPDFLVRMRRDGFQLEILNRGAIHLIQPDAQAIPGTWVTEIMPPDIAQERLHLAAKALATGRVQTQEYQFELNGLSIYEEARIAPLGADEVLVVVRDITDRHRSEAALRASEEKFRQLAENIHQVFFVLSVKGEVLYISPAYEQIWQQSSDRLYQNPYAWLESVHPDDCSRVLAAFQRKINLQESFDEVYRIVRPDGEMHWIAAQFSPLQDETGTVTRFIGLAEDITQQKHAEAALRQSEATKQAIIEAIPDLLMRMQADGTNLEFISNTDFNVIPDLDQLAQNVSLTDVLDSDLCQLRLTYAQRAIATGQTQVYEHKICIDEQWHYEEIRITPLTQDAVLVMIRNITDRKQAELELLHEKDRFQAIVSHIPIMVTLFNDQGKVEFVNPALEQILGWSLAEWQARDLVPECYPDPVHRQRVLEHMLAATGQWRDIPIRTARGQQLETSWANVRLSDGRFLGIGQDITDRKQKELALQQAMEAAEAANMAKSMFLANMSHELRTPLNVILGFTQIMAHDPSLTPSQQADLETIQRSGDHLLSLINEVLDLSKIESGHYNIDMVHLDLIDLLHTLRSMMTERVQAKGIGLTFEIAPEVPQFVITDEKKLRQVLLNLLTNAIKFTQVGGITLQATAPASATPVPPPVGPTVTVAPSTAPPIVLQFVIADTGPGIAPTELDTIFDAFVQAEAGRKASSGTGLGLAISRKLLELMGGEITVSSTLGVGSTFTIRLPVYPTIGTTAEPSFDERVVIGLRPGQPHRRVLVVDDQLENRQLMVRILSQLGLAVREATNGQEAVQLWRDWQPDLIWMDIRMPILDGYEATKQIRALEGEPTSVIIALTAQASQSDRTLALAAGCNDYISKPFRETTLFLKMAEYLGLEYLYAESNREASTVTPSDHNPEDRLVDNALMFNLAALSASDLCDLEAAAIRGDDRAIVAIAAQLPPAVAHIATQVTALAEQYQFEQILKLIHDRPSN